MFIPLIEFCAIALTVTIASPVCASVTRQSAAEVMHDVHRRLNTNLNLKKESTSWVKILMTQSY